MRVIVLVLPLILLAAAAFGQNEETLKDSDELFFEADFTEVLIEDDKFIKKYTGSVHVWNKDIEAFCDSTMYHSSDGFARFMGHVFMKDSARVVEAEIIEYQLKIREAMAVGNAVMQDSAGIIQADTIIYRSDPGLALAIGNAVLKDSTRTIHADSVKYSWEDSIATASGNVIITEESRRLDASFVRYNRKDESVEALGNPVQLTDSERNAVFTGTKLFYSDIKENGFVTGSPMLEKKEDEIFTITCSDSIYFNTDVNSVLFRWDVHMIKGETEVWADEARYIGAASVNEGTDSTMVILSGSPRVQHTEFTEDPETDETLRGESIALGDSLFIHFIEGELSHFLVSGDASGYYYRWDASDSLREAVKLTSHKMDIEIVGGKVNQASADGMAESFYRRYTYLDEDPFFNQTQGDTIRFFFRDGKIEKTMTFKRGVSAIGTYYEFVPVNEDTVLSVNDTTIAVTTDNKRK